MIRTFLLFPLIALFLRAQVHVPQMGSIRCADGSVRPVYGVPASFVLGKPLFLSATSSSFSNGGGIVATREGIRLFDVAGQSIGEMQAADPAVLVNIDSDASSAIAWLPKTASLAYWEEGAFHQIVLPSPPSGHITSVRRDGSRALLLVLEEGGVSEDAISLSSGQLLSASFLSGVEGPAFRQGQFILFPSAAGLEIEGPNGRRSLGLLSSDLSMERMGSGWIHIFSASATQHWALHFSDSVLQLFELPSVARLEAAQ